RDKMNFLNEKNAYTYDPSCYPAFFYVPAGTTQVQYKVQANGLRIIAPSGNTVNTTLIKKTDDGFEVMSFDVPSGASGKFWQAIVTGNYNYQLINIPDRYFILSHP
ncbi:MAG TPA: hypothetical protein VGC95_09630, partial [Chitinophagaceae bacterium]